MFPFGDGWLDELVDAPLPYSISIEEVGAHGIGKKPAADDLIAQAFGIAKANAETWGAVDAAEPQPERYFEETGAWTSLMKSAAKFEMLRNVITADRVIVDGNKRDKHGNPLIVHWFSSGQGAEAQTAWNKIHAPLAAEIQAKKKAYLHGMGGKKPKSNHAMVTQLATHIPGIHESAKCPECSSVGAIFHMIQHINDVHRWKREEIADWLETLDADLTVKAEAVTPKPAAWAGIVPDKLAFDEIVKENEEFESQLLKALATPITPLDIDKLKEQIGISPPPKLPEFDTAALSAAMETLGAAIKDFVTATYEAANTLTEFLAKVQDATPEKKEQD